MGVGDVTQNDSRASRLKNYELTAEELSFDQLRGTDDLSTETCFRELEAGREKRKAAESNAEAKKRKTDNLNVRL